MDAANIVSHDHIAESSAEEIFRLVVEACPSGMVLSEDDGKIVLVNNETERLFGYPRDELVGQKIEILMPERLRNGHYLQRANFARKPGARRMGKGRDLLGRHRDGREFPVEIGLSPIQTAEGLMVLSFIADITERKRLDKLKDEFVSTVSHELRTPLTSIAGSLGLLVGGAAGKLPPAALRLIDIAQGNSQRLVRLINDILDIEKLESGQLAFKFKRVAARALAEQVIESTRAYADGFHVRARLNSAGGLGEVYADPDRLAQVITNLLSNAIKFSPRNGEVVVDIEERTSTVRVAVRDHGPGIPIEFKPLVFEKFAQADATDARQKGGTGLGLSIVKQIVNRLGGAVGFDDAPGGGTIFHVELPSWAQIAAREFDPERIPGAVHILLCEDDPDVAFALREGLRPSGFCTDFAFSPGDAIARTRADRYAAIVVDMDFPNGDGLDLIRRLREQPQIYNTPIVAVSADASRKFDGADLRTLKVVERVTKPVDIDRLAHILSTVAASDAVGSPRILHVDDDRRVLELVAAALAPTAIVVSVDSIEGARHALLMHRFDLAILDICIGNNSGLELLPELRGRKGNPVPVIVFSAHGGTIAANPQVEANVDKASASLKDLMAAVHDRLMLKSPPAAKEAS
jgi:PAS domain S-box-containing protein